MRCQRLVNLYEKLLVLKRLVLDHAEVLCLIPFFRLNSFDDLLFVDRVLHLFQNPLPLGDETVDEVLLHAGVKALELALLHIVYDSCA